MHQSETKNHFHINTKPAHAGGWDHGMVQFCRGIDVFTFTELRNVEQAKVSRNAFHGSETKP